MSVPIDVTATAGLLEDEKLFSAGKVQAAKDLGRLP